MARTGQNQESIHSDPTGHDASSSRISVLYIDDNAINTLVLERAFEKMDHLTLTCAPTGAAGVASAAAEPPDVILLDHYLRYMTGPAVWRELRAHSALAHTPIVIVSADAHLDRAQYSGEPNLHYLPKPFDIHAVVGLLNRLTERAAPLV